MPVDPRLAARSVTSKDVAKNALVFIADPSGDLDPTPVADIKSLTFTDGYVNPTLARNALVKARIYVKDVWGYDETNKLSPKLFVGFVRPVTEAVIAQVQAILTSLIGKGGAS